MKALKITGIVLGGIIALLLIIPLFISNDMNYETSMTINAPIDSVWKYVGTFEGHNKWTPWIEYDPNMKQTLTGTDGSVGAVHSWESKVENVGSGSQTIVNIKAPTTFDTKLVFKEPFESKSDAYLHMSTVGTGTKVVWGFKSKVPYPFNTMCLFMDFKKEMDKDFIGGLTELKKLCEK